MKSRFRTPVRFVALAMTAVLGLAACGTGGGSEPAADAAVTAPADMVKSGELTYGVAASFPPFEYKDGTTLTGFDVEMAEALAGYLGLKTAPLDIDFDGLIPALKGKRIDVINSAMYINDERSEQVDFIPYAVVGEALLVPKGNEFGISTVPDDLSGRTIAVTRGAIGETYMNKFNDELTAAGKEPMKVLPLPTNQDALLAVKSGRADGFDTSTPGAAYTLTQEADVFEVAETFELGTQIGLAVPKGSTEMKAALEEALALFVSDGKYAELLAKYNLPAESSIFE